LRRPSSFASLPAISPASLGLSIALVFACALQSPARASEAAPSRASGVLMPREVYVGDTAEFTFDTGALNAVLSPGFEEYVDPEDISVTSDATVESILVVRGAAASSITVRFVPWTTGLLDLPPFRVKKARVVPPPVRISSLAERTGATALEPPRSPLLVPGTTLILYALIAAALVFLITFLVTAIRLRRYLSVNRGKFRSGRRVRLAMRELKYLERKMDKASFAEWYALYAQTLRRYLGAFSGEGPSGLLCATASEIAESLRVLAPGFADAANRVESRLSSIDLIRFSGRPHGDSRTSDIAEARILIDCLEEALAAVRTGEDQINV